MNVPPTLGLYVLRAAGYAPFLILFGLGFLRVLRERRFRTAPWTVLHLGVLGTVLTALIFGGLPRFRDANAGLLMIYAVVGLGWMLRRPDPPAEAEKQTTSGAT